MKSSGTDPDLCPRLALFPFDPHMDSLHGASPEFSEGVRMNIKSPFQGAQIIAPNGASLFALGLGSTSSVARSIPGRT